MSASKFTGGFALSREIGVSPGTVTRKRQAGMTDEQIRREAKLRAATVAAGGRVMGRVKGTRMDPELLRKGIARVKTVPVPTPAPFQPNVQTAATSVGRTYVPSKLRSAVVGPARVPIVSPVVPVSVIEQTNVFDSDKPGDVSVFDDETPDEIRDPVTGENIAQAQLRKEIAIANERELNVAMKRREVVPVVQVDSWYSGVVITCRDMMMRLGSDNRDRWAAETDPVKLERMVEKEVRKILSVLQRMDGERDGQEETAA